MPPPESASESEAVPQDDNTAEPPEDAPQPNVEEERPPTEKRQNDEGLEKAFTMLP